MNSDQRPDILLVDDEIQIRRMLTMTLEEAGYGVREAESGRIALGEVALRQPHLVILDLGLPDASGTDVLKALRHLCAVPVLILSVKGHEKSKVEALDAGADDYLTKPFGGEELLARIRALLRRVQPAEVVETVFRFGHIQVDLERSRVLKNGQLIKLTAMEFKLLRMLVLHRDKVLTHHNILSELWGPKAVQNTNYLRIHMMHLRRKLGEEVDSAGHFQTESGVGYRFVSDPSPST
jgi:two-component system KDP operon response regulator KdpE